MQSHDAMYEFHYKDENNKVRDFIILLYENLCETQVSWISFFNELSIFVATK